MNDEINKKELRLTRVKLILILLVFGLPLIFAMIMAQLSRDGLPDFLSTTNYGDFVEPTVPLTNLDLMDETGAPLGFDQINGFWTLAYISEAGCDEICQEQIYALRQLRIMNGKNIDRIQRLFIYSGLNQKEQQSVRETFPGLIMGTGNERQLAKVISAFKTKGHDSDDRIYLIDPKGNLMMSYRKEINPRHIYFDVKRLLKVLK